MCHRHCQPCVGACLDAVERMFFLFFFGGFACVCIFGVGKWMSFSSGGEDWDGGMCVFVVKL